MGAKRFKDLVAWQRADVVRQYVWHVVKATPHMDAKFRVQWTDAATSTCGNLAEGFGRYSHRDFARFVRQASSSLNEVEDQAHEARMRGYLTAVQSDELQLLIRRASVPIARLLRYLRDTPDR